MLMTGFHLQWDLVVSESIVKVQVHQVLLSQLYSMISLDMRLFTFNTDVWKTCTSAAIIKSNKTLTHFQAIYHRSELCFFLTARFFFLQFQLFVKIK